MKKRAKKPLRTPLFIRNYWILLFLWLGATALAGESGSPTCRDLLLSFNRGPDKVAFFNLENLGIPRKSFLAAVNPTFRKLAPDFYLLKQEQVRFLMQRYPDQAVRLRLFLKDYWDGVKDLTEVKDLVDGLSDAETADFRSLSPSRFRGISKFKIERIYGQAETTITEINENSFRQDQLRDEQDLRKRSRTFSRSPEEFRKHPLLRKLLLNTFEIITNTMGGLVTEIEITVHQMSIVAENGGKATNSPEGVHQDGYDFIVSALVVERSNVKGGQSIVFDADQKTKILSIELQEGQGILQTDRNTNLHHVVTEIEQDDPSKPAIRNIIGLDITIKKSEVSVKSPGLEVEVLEGTFAISQLPARSGQPDWVRSEFHTFSSLPDEVSVVSLENLVPAGIRTDKGWSCLKAKGPLPFHAVGALDSLTHPLSKAGISIFPLGTFNTDYVLVKSADLDRAILVLRQAGHRIER